MCLFSTRAIRKAKEKRLALDNTGRSSQYVIYVTRRAGKISFWRQRFVGMPTQTCLCRLSCYTTTHTDGEGDPISHTPRVRLYLYRCTIYEFNRADFPPQNVYPVRRQGDEGSPINSRHVSVNTFYWKFLCPIGMQVCLH